MSSIDFKETEKKIQEYWRKEGINNFDKASKKPLFTIDVPPPTVSGQMHMGHAMAYTQADAIARYKKMKGFEVFYPFGFDDNGLPTERFVEKKLGIKAKKMKRQEFFDLCLKETRAVEEELRKDFQSLGLAIDWNLLYTTIGENSQRIAQTSFVDLYEKKRVYRKKAPSMYCVTCETAIAQAELKDFEKETFFNDIEFELKKGGKIVISTTRPELLAACVAVFVNPDDKRFRGLIGKKAIVPLFEHEVEVKGDKRVEAKKETGIVMSCTFGDQTDMEWFNAYNLDLRMVIDESGIMNEKAGKYRGLRIEKAREEIIKELQEKGVLKAQKKTRHSVNVHERCGTPVEIIVATQWFLKYLDLKDYFLRETKKITWKPEFMKTRLDNWIRNLQWDWCISRQRFFGIMFPLWYCKKCGKEIVAEKKDLPVNPLKDKPRRKCSCGSGEFKPEKDVFDTWFTSSLTPQINAKWMTDGRFFSKVFPMSIRTQGHDIINLWAFNTIVKSLLHHERVPWNEIMINGFALDAKGKKMSKSRGNVIKPDEIISKYSVDMLRCWALSSNLGDDLPFQEKELVAGRKLLMKIYNASRFVETLSKEAGTEIDYDKLRLEDKWILSRLQKTIKECDESLNEFDFFKALRKTREFFWHDFCDYYIEEVKNRVYNEEDSEAKKVLKYVMITVLRLFAPLLPHTADDIYLNSITFKEKNKSIHLDKFPEFEEEKIDTKSEALGETAKEIISAVRRYKTDNNMSLSRELSRAVVYFRENQFKEEELEMLIKNTCRINELELSPNKAPENALKVNERISVMIKEE